MSYFRQLEAENERITELADIYLAKLPFMDNETVSSLLYRKADQMFTAAHEDWDAVPEWVANIMDGWMPYQGQSNNGSLAYGLGYSSASNDAHLRNLLEIAEGRETELLDFPVVAKAEVVET